MFKKTLLAVAMGLSIITMSACSDDDDDYKPTVPEQEEEKDNADNVSLLDAIKSRDDLTYVASLVESGKLGELEANLKLGEFTLFLPSDEALTAFVANEGYTSLDELLADPKFSSDKLRLMFLYHAVEGKFTKDDFGNRKKFRSEANDASSTGTDLVVNKNGDDYYLTDSSMLRDNTSKIIATDIKTKDDVIHVIDDVLIKGEKKVATQSIAEIVAASDDFTILEQALVKTGLASTFAGTDKFTVFAPTDAAFKKLAGELGVEPAQLLADKDALTNILKYHVVNGTVTAIDVSFGAGVKTLNDKNITITQDGDGMMVTDLSGDADNVADITTPNVMATNGVIHIIDDVLLPMSLKSDNGGNNTQTLLNLMASDPELSDLKDIVEAQNLASALQGDNLTVFAPTNAAFAQFYKASGYSKQILMSPLATSQVAAVIKYHILPQKITSSQLMAGKFDTLNGAKLTINADKKILNSTGAIVNIQDADNMAKNGVFHKIDNVLIPPTK